MSFSDDFVSDDEGVLPQESDDDDLFECDSSDDVELLGHLAKDGVKLGGVRKDPDELVSESLKFIHSLRKLENCAAWDEKFPAMQIVPVLETLAKGQVDKFTAVLDTKRKEWARWNQFIPTALEVWERLRKADQETGKKRLKEVHWVGSLAKETAVRPETADIDMVLIFKDFEPQGGRGYAELLDWVEATLKSGDLGHEISRRAFYFNMAMKFPNTGPQGRRDVERADPRLTGYLSSSNDSSLVHRGVQTNTNDGPGELVKREAQYIHLGPAAGPSVDILIGGEERPIEQMFNPDNEEDWVFWGATSSVKCVEFVLSQPPFVRTAIRAVKAWRDKLGINKGRYRPSSFLLELLCIWAYETHKERTAPGVFWRVLKIMNKPDKDIFIYWTKFYPVDKIPAGVLKQRPLVLDPLKPWNNVVRPANIKWARKHIKPALTSQ